MIGLIVVLLISFSNMVTMVFSSMGSRSYFREWVWNIRTNLCCIALGK